VIDVPRSHCLHQRTKKDGTTQAGTQRFRCLDCGKKFTASTKQLDGMRIGTEKAAQIVNLLCEGMSVRATSRFTNTDVATILDLLLLVGFRCQRFLFKTYRDLEVNDVQADEIWQYIYCKRRNVDRVIASGHDEPVGDSFTFTAVERHTKLVLAWHFGCRTGFDTTVFCRKLRHATKGYFHLSTDGYNAYPAAVAQYFAGQIDYGQLVKHFGKSSVEDQRTYSPAAIIGCDREVVMGAPDLDRICTSHTERHNGSIRNFTKRTGRLTYCFSKKWTNHEAALGLYFAHYNFCHKHRTLYVKGEGPRTAAMAAGLTDHVWTVADLLEAVSAETVAA
jgi:transposase-like protein/IS1 family transposase